MIRQQNSQKENTKIIKQRDDHEICHLIQGIPRFSPMGFRPRRSQDARRYCGWCNVPRCPRRRPDQTNGPEKGGCFTNENVGCLFGGFGRISMIQPRLWFAWCFLMDLEEFQLIIQPQKRDLLLSWTLFKQQSGMVFEWKTNIDGILTYFNVVSPHAKLD